MRFPFEASWSEVEADLETFVDAVFSCLESEFLVLPKGAGFVDYPVFEKGYEALRLGTSGFERLDTSEVLGIVEKAPVALLVLRSMLGFTPPEWAYLATQRTGTEVSQGAVRSIDRKIRLAPLVPLTLAGLTGERIKALVALACQLLTEGMPEVAANRLHRLDKVDTRGGPAAICTRAMLGVPYAMLLYERFLGRPFAGHRDSVSDLVGDVLESAVGEVLHRAGVTFRRTRRAERVEGFDQAPDFIVPDEFNPQVVIEAKLTEDDGTARDKVARVQHLGELAASGMPPGQRRFEVVACIDGRGFGVRRKDMQKLLQATHGKVFTMQNLDRLVECTRVRDYSTNQR